MKTKIDDDGLLIIPETDFEEDYLRKDFKGNLKAFLKHGVTLKELIGIKICKAEALNERPLMASQNLRVYPAKELIRRETKTADPAIKKALTH